MSYQVYIGRKALKTLEKIRSVDYHKIKDSIQSLSHSPQPPGHKKLIGRAGYRIRQGDYRIVYDIYEAERKIEVLAIGHRKDIYR